MRFGRSFLLVAIASCGGQGSTPAADGGSDRASDALVDAHHHAHSDASPHLHDASSSDGRSACSGYPIDLASLTAHNTSANAAYDQSHFPANFGTSTWVSQSGTTIPVDPARADTSLNPVTPGHVSATDVHTLIPSRLDLRWFAHVTPWFRSGGGGGHVDVGLDCDSTAYVKAMVTDMKNRGFDGLIVDWYGQGSYEDSVTLLVQSYVATLPLGSFSFIIMMDKGISGLSQSVLETQVKYVQAQYFADPNYELEVGQPILMFFGVDSALGSSTMASVKAATGGNMVWVTEGASSLGESWVDECFDWTHDYHSGDSPSDPYNLAGISGFYSSVKSSSKKVFGSMVAGFDGTLTANVSWSKGKYLPRGSGACLVKGAKTIDSVIPSNVTRMQWATWSDWEEGSEVESGVENDVSVTASLAKATLRWTVSGGTGDESTIHHYEVYASRDGVHAADLGSVPTGTHSFELAHASCVEVGSSYSFVVVAVGQASIRDHASAAVTGAVAR